MERIRMNGSVDAICFFPRRKIRSDLLPILSQLWPLSPPFVPSSKLLGGSTVAVAPSDENKERRVRSTALRPMMPSSPFATSYSSAHINMRPSGPPIQAGTFRGVLEVPFPEGNMNVARWISVSDGMRDRNYLYANDAAAAELELLLRWTNTISQWRCLNRSIYSEEAEENCAVRKLSDADVRVGTVTHKHRANILTVGGLNSASGRSFLLSFLDSLTSTHFRQLNFKEAHGACLFRVEEPVSW